jgi:predicted transglutaminase-like cysteine proteinase
MWTNASARAYRAVMLACAVVLSSPAVEVSAASLLPPPSIDPGGSVTEPFGLPASTISFGGLRDKWLGVERALDDEMLVLMLCEENRAHCASAAALKFLAVVDEGRAHEGRARLGLVNRAVNLAIRPVSDLEQYGSIDVWSSPLATFASGAGDCEDYAIAKYVALRLAGVAGEDLRLTIVRDTVQQEDHAVVAARLDGRWLVLDNRRLPMIEDGLLPQYRPLFVIDADGVRQYRAVPMLVASNGPRTDGARTIDIASRAEPASSN